MKKLFLFFLTLCFFSAPLAGQVNSIKDTDEYRTARELLDKADSEKERGDYDQSAEYARQAADYAAKAGRYGTVFFLRYEAERLKRAAGNTIEEAKTFGAHTNTASSPVYSRALSFYAEGDLFYYTNDFIKEYESLTENYGLSITAFSNAWETGREALRFCGLSDAINKYIAEAREGRRFLQINKIISSGDDSDREIAALISDAESMLTADNLEESLKKAKAAVDLIVKIKLKFQAEKLLAITLERIGKAESIDKTKKYENEINSAKEHHKQGTEFFAGENYSSAIDEARSALEWLEKTGLKIDKIEYYKVRFIPECRDCLWRIAGYSFIYGDPEKWRIIFKANEQLFKGRSSDLIYPGEEFFIPDLPAKK